MTTRRVRLFAVLTSALIGVGGLAACADNSKKEAGGGGSGSSAAAAGCTPDPSASATPTGSPADSVPAAVKSKGVLTVGIDPTYAPNEYKDSSGKIVGFDVDLFDAVAAKLGLTAQYQESTFDNIIPGIQGGKYDVGASSFTDNCARQQVVDFVTYFSAGTQWAAPTGATVDANNACGKNVAVQTGTVQDTDDLPARSKTCTSAGKPAIKVLRYDDQGQATNAVVLGKADAMLADSPIAAYAVKQSAGKLALSGDVYDAAPYGYAIGKKQGTLKVAIQGALDAMIADGSYKKVLDTWGFTQGAVTGAALNAATS